MANSVQERIAIIEAFYASGLTKQQQSNLPKVTLVDEKWYRDNELVEEPLQSLLTTMCDNSFKLRDMMETPKYKTKLTDKQKVEYIKSVLTDWQVEEGDFDSDLNSKSSKAGYIMGIGFTKGNTTIALGLKTFGCSDTMAIFNTQEFGDGSGFYHSVKTEGDIDDILEMAQELS